MSPQDPMLWIPGREIIPEDTEAFRISDIPMGRIKVRAPTIVWKIEKPDLNRLWSNTLESIIKFTKEGAAQFGTVAAEEIRKQIANFSKPTKGGKTSEFGSFTPHEELDLTGQSLYQSIGWRHFEEGGDWKAEAGPGIGRGRSLPLNVKGKSYAGFVEKGTGESRGRFVPKMVDIELSNAFDPTRTTLIKNIPKTWVPKMSSNVNVLLEGWWAANKKRALLKKRSRSAIGRYFSDPSSQLLKVRHAGARKTLSKAKPTYNITIPGRGRRKPGTRVGGPGEGFGLGYYHKSVGYTSPFTSEIYKGLKSQSGGDLDKLNELTSEYLDEITEYYDNFKHVMGGTLRGRGGIHNILRSIGDYNYAMFTIDLRLEAQDLGDYAQGMLQGMPGYVTGQAINERGLGVRIPKSRWGGDPGTHPGTPARNYMHNAAANMRKHLRRWIKEARTGKGKDVGLRMFANWGRD